MTPTDEEVKRFEAQTGIDSVMRPVMVTCVYASDHDRIVSSLREEVERLRGLKPEMPPFPPGGDGLPRYGLRWNGAEHPLAVPMGDGYWTPWHLAANDARRLDFLESESTLHKQPEILYVVDGYLLEIVDERSRTMRAGQGATLRNAIDSAMEKPE